MLSQFDHFIGFICLWPSKVEIILLGQWCCDMTIKSTSIIYELMTEKMAALIWLRLQGFAPKSHQHHPCVVPTPHLSNLCDTWLTSIDMREICQPPCLFTVCADSLAGCLFVYSLSRSKQMPSLFSSAFPLSHRVSESESLNSYRPCCTDLFTELYVL